MNPDIDERFKQVEALADSVCDALCKEVLISGLPVNHIDPSPGRAEFKLSRDPYDGSYSLIGTWRDSRGHKQGEILFHGDGSFFAEYDVISEHPAKPHWFIEAVTAWGNHQQLNAELRLLPSAR